MQAAGLGEMPVGFGRAIVPAQPDPEAEMRMGLRDLLCDARQLARRRVAVERMRAGRHPGP